MAMASDALETLVGTDPLNPCDPVGVDTDKTGFVASKS